MITFESSFGNSGPSYQVHEEGVKRSGAGGTHHQAGAYSIDQPIIIEEGIRKSGIGGGSYQTGYVVEEGTRKSGFGGASHQTGHVEEIRKSGVGGDSYQTGYTVSHPGVYEDRGAVSYETGYTINKPVAFEEHKYGEYGGVGGGVSYQTNSYSINEPFIREEGVKRAGVGSSGVEVHKTTEHVTSYQPGEKYEYTTSYQPSNYVEEKVYTTADFKPSYYTSYEGPKEEIRHSGVNVVTTHTYEPYQHHEEVVKRSGATAGPQLISSSDYKVSDYKPYEHKEYKVETTENVIPYDYRTGNFATFEYKPTTEVKTFVEYQPVTRYETYKVEDYDVGRTEGVKRAGVTETVVIEKHSSGGEEAQIRQMGEEIERIRSSNSEIFGKFERLQKLRIEIQQNIYQKESELEIIRRGGEGQRDLRIRIEEKEREIERLKISGGNVKTIDNSEETNQLLHQIKEKEYHIEALRKKIKEIENQRNQYLSEISNYRETSSRGKGGTAWCC